jgi:single-strand DNA-binding protein
MAGSLNKVILIGNVGKDPEIRTTQDGREIVSFSLATSESWRDKASGERREKTEWHRVVIFAPPLVNIAKNYVHKGSKLYLEGALQTRKWTDQAGAEKMSTEIVLQNYNSVIVLLDARNSSGATPDFESPDFDNSPRGGFSGKQNSSSDSTADILDDDIPF